MTASALEPAVKRILLALGGFQDPTAFDAVAGLAAKLGAQLFALFVEDIDLLRMASLPFAREIGHLSAAERALDAAEMERWLQGQAARTEQVLADLATRSAVPFSFRIARGNMVREAMACAAEADLVVFASLVTPQVGLPRVDDSHSRRRKGKSRTGIGRVAVALYGDTPAANRAGTLAARLAQALGSGLTVLVVAPSATAYERLREQITDWPMAGQMRYRWVSSAEPRSLAAAVHSETASMLVTSEGDVIPSPEAINALLAELECPLILTR